VVIHLSTVGFNSKENEMTTPKVTPATPNVPPVVQPNVTHPTVTQPQVATIPNPPKQPVSQNVIQPSPTMETLAAEPKLPNHPLNQLTQNDVDRKDARARGYSLGPDAPKSTRTIRNIHTNALNLESGIIEPGQTGLATDAEVSCLLGKYVEVS
jgi:hypothetical protein